MNADLRKHWQLDPQVAFLNHGSFGASQRRVLAFQQSLRDEMEREPVRFLWRDLPERIHAARAGLAGFLGSDTDRLAFVPNATAGVAAVLRSVQLRAGDEVLTTDHAYNACRNALDEAATRTGATLVVATIPFPICSSDEALEAVLARVTPRTRFALVDHVTSPTALVLPILEIVRALESRGVETLVDGAHAPGMLDLDIGELRPAWYTGNLHKWVCAPKGAAFLWTRDDLRDSTLPPVISHGWNTPRPGSSRYHDLFDWTGTFDPTAWLCVPEAIRFIGSLHPQGWAGVRETIRRTLVDARRTLAGALELETPCPGEMLGSMATLPLPGGAHASSAEACRRLQLALFDRHRIEVPVFTHGGRGWFRISAHLHNSPADYRRLAEALPGVAGNHGIA